MTLFLSVNVYSGKRFYIWSCAFFVLCYNAVTAQNYTLEQVIELARKQSPSYYQAINTRESSYWAYQAYKAQFLPQVSLEGTLPNYTKSFSQFQQPDGTYQPSFVNQNYSNLNLFVNQQIGLTGTRIFANSSLVRFDNFLPNLPTTQLNPQYTGSPFLVGLQQKIFGYIPIRWEKKIQPLRFEESKKAFAEEMENIAVNAAGRFFDLMLAQINLQIAERNQANNDTILQIARGRYNLGKIGEDEILQLELTLMRANQEVSQAKLDIETYSLNMKRYIGLTDNDPVVLVLPETVPNFSIDENTAIKQAHNNRQNPVAFKRRLLESERDIAQAKSLSGLNVDLFAQYGLSNQAGSVGNLYKNPNNQQNLSLGFTIPIVSWGRNLSLRKTAQANFELTKSLVAQNELSFEQEVVTQVKQFKMLEEQLRITEKSSQIGQKRYDISRNRYLIGKISITDLNIALQEKDQARRGYIQSLRQFWTAYYNLRRLTLFDFQTGTPLLEKENN
jgi:outer membrane protein TolC